MFLSYNTDRVRAYLNLKNPEKKVIQLKNCSECMNIINCLGIYELVENQESVNKRIAKM